MYFSFIFYSLFVTPAFASQLFLGIGEQRKISLPFKVSHYSIGSNAVRVHLSDSKSSNYSSQFLVKGLKKGSADLWIQGSEGQEQTHRIQVMEWPEFSASTPAFSLIAALQEVEVIAHQNQALIQGIVSKTEEWRNLGQLSRLATTLSSGKIEIQVELSENLKKICLQELRTTLDRIGFSNRVTVNEVFNPPLVQGPVAENRMTVVRDSLSQACPLARLDLETLGEKSSTLYFRVFLLELKKTEFHRFGLQPESIVNGLQAKLSQMGSLFELNRQFQFLSTDGKLKILSKPELSVRSPGEAELFAGGEIPIRVTTRNNSNVIWKNYGLSLKIKVNQSTSEKVRLEIATEVSHLDVAHTVDAIPAIKSNRMKTQVDAPLGQPLFLSGLLHEGMRKDSVGLPALKDIPVLGALFSSQSYQSEQSELVAILLPHGQPISAPMEKVGLARFPKGPVPAPRNWISTDEVQELQNDSNYPWNALE